MIIRGGGVIKSKQLLILPIMLILLLSMQLSVLAASSEIYADNVTAQQGKTVLIPIKIKRNPGIMGFKINVEYDKSVLSSPSVSAGVLTGNGSLNDSIGVTPEGTFDVVWNSTQDVKGDGTVLILGFKALKEGQSEIKLSYSQPDTFNEKWEDVLLDCKSITATVSDTAATQASTATPSITQTNDDNNTATTQNATPASSVPKNETVKAAVEMALSEFSVKSIDEIKSDEQKEFVSRTNEILGQLNEAEREYYADIDELKDAYKTAVADEFINDALQSVDSDKITAAVDDALGEVGAKTVNEIPPEKQAEFVKAVERKLSESAPDMDIASDKLSGDEALKMISELDSKAEKAATEGTPVPQIENGKNSKAIIIAVLVIVALAAGAVVYIASKNKRRNKSEEEKSE